MGLEKHPKADSLGLAPSSADSIVAGRCWMDALGRRSGKQGGLVGDAYPLRPRALYQLPRQSVAGQSVRWQALQKEFYEYIGDSVGHSKPGSGLLVLSFDADGHATVELGTYDVGDWPRHTYLGPFATEDEAYEAARLKVEETKAILDAETIDIQGDV